MAKKPTAPPKAPKKAPTPRGDSQSEATPPGRPDPAKVWDERLTAANKVYDTWSKEYDCPKLDKYYRGKHWHGLAETEAEKKYVINLIFATVETQLPTLLFSKPKVLVEARPDHETTANSEADSRATLIQQALQTRVDDPKLHFTFETTLSLRDAYSRFAIVEVGYTADWIDNPNAGKPMLNDRDEVMADSEGEAVLQPDKVLKEKSKESLFVKRVAPNSFRCSPGRNLLEANDWVAYAEWFYVEDVKKNPDYTHTADLKATGSVATSDDEDASADPDQKRHAGQVRVWKIWDLRTKTRHVYAEGHKRLLQTGKAFEALPLFDLKFYELPDAFYPLPPLYNWISPQDELNESAEMRKVHRRRAVRRYMREPSVKKEEFEKLETGEDMVCIEVPKITPPPIAPIPDAPLDGATWQQLAATKDDFLQITGVSGEARGSQETETTATQANIVNVRAQMRESRARAQVADWLGRICRHMLVTIRAQMQLPFMVQRSVDPFSFPSDPTQVARGAQAWKEIKAEDLGDLDVDVKIDVASLSPVAEDNQRQQWNIVLQLFTNPALVTMLMEPDPKAPQQVSPLLRKTLMLNGISSDQEIQTIWRIAQALMAKLTAAAQAKAGAEQRPEPMKLSLSLKGEDLANPLVTWILRREELLQNAPLPPAMPDGSDGSGGGAGIPGPPGGPATGIPAAPASVG